MGDPVNVAARVQELTRETGDTILLAGSTRELLTSDRARFVPRGRVPIRGKSLPVDLYAVTTEAECERASPSSTCSEAMLERRAIEGVAEAYSRYDRVLSVATEVSTYDDEVRRFWRGLVERFVDATDRHIALEQSEGRIRPLDSRRTAEALVWMTERACYVYVARRERAPRDVVAALTEVWVGALYAQR